MTNVTTTNKPQNMVLLPKEPVNAVNHMPIVDRGGSYYLRLSPDFLRYYDLTNGDVLEFQVLSVRKKRPADWVGKWVRRIIEEDKEGNPTLVSLEYLGGDV